MKKQKFLKEVANEFIEHVKECSDICTAMDTIIADAATEDRKDIEDCQ